MAPATAGAQPEPSGAAISAQALWRQLRIVHFEAAELPAEAGLDVVMNRCVKLEHGRF